MTDSLLQFFEYGHLRPDLASVARPFAELAHWVVQNVERNAERTVALRKLLEAKDAAVRARLFRAAASTAERRSD